jgi:hypothetical protein
MFQTIHQAGVKGLRIERSGDDALARLPDEVV